MWKIFRQSSTVNSFNGRCDLCIEKKISIKIADDCFMNVTNLCLNVDIKVDLNYPD